MECELYAGWVERSDTPVITQPALHFCALLKMQSKDAPMPLDLAPTTHRALSRRFSVAPMMDWMQCTLTAPAS